MKSKPITVFGLTCGLLMVSAPLIAHHGSASYDTTKKTTVKGTVTDFQFMNPHTEITVETKGDDGNVEKWLCEAGSSSLLTRMGWSRNLLKPGDQITVIGNRAKNGSNTLRLDKVILPDGQELNATGIPDY